MTDNRGIVAPATLDIREIILGIGPEYTLKDQLNLGPSACGQECEPEVGIVPHSQYTPPRLQLGSSNLLLLSKTH